jgi:hypothetical protein
MTAEQTPDQIGREIEQVRAQLAALQAQQSQQQNSTPEWETPSHQEVNLATVEPEDLGLDSFNTDDPLVKAIYQAQERDGNIPAELKAKPNWVRWKLDTVDRRLTKVPYQLNGSKASSTDRTTWNTYDAIVAGAVIDEAQGTGIMTDGSFVGFDLDGCRNPVTGEIKPWAQRVIDMLGTYTEVTPSGYGVRVYALGQLPDGARRFSLALSAGFGEKVGIECYSEKRYFTVTGRRIGAHSGLRSSNVAQAHQLCAEISREFPSESRNASISDTSGDTVSAQIKRGSAMLFTSKLPLLMYGKITSDKPFVVEDEYGNSLEYPSHSEADMALATVLAIKHKGDAELIDQEFRESVLYRPKWDRLAEQTIAKAIESAKKLAEKASIEVEPKSFDAGQACTEWRKQFRNLSEMEQGDIVMIIDGVLQEGTCFLGANPGNGKTLVALALAKSICLGEPLFGISEYTVKQPRNVIYLIPEVGDKPFRKRGEAFRLPSDDRFIARTISSGGPLALSDPALMEAVRQMKPVVVLDTASRFLQANDENSAAQNRLLVNDIVSLRAAGAVCVIILHHAKKSQTTKREAMTLDNMLRGTSDFGAMCDQAYGVRMDERIYNRGAGPMEIELVNLKDRERLGGLTSIRLAASYKKPGSVFPTSYIDETGNFRPVDYKESKARDEETLNALVQANTMMTITELAEATGLKPYTVKGTLAKLGWHCVKGGPDGRSPWHKDDQGCPHQKARKTGLAVNLDSADLATVN